MGHVCEDGTVALQDGSSLLLIRFLPFRVNSNKPFLFLALFRKIEYDDVIC